MKPRLCFLLVIILSVLFYSNSILAENTYNFYFDSDSEDLPQIPAARGEEIVTEFIDKEIRVGAPIIKPGFNTEKLPTMRRVDPDSFRGFRLGAAYNTALMQGEFEAKSGKNETAFMPGVTFSVRLFPIKYFGLFGEATIGGETINSFVDISNMSGFSRLFYNFGAEIIPLRIAFFGIDDIMEVSGEIGFSTLYYSYYKSGSTGFNGSTYNMLNYREFDTGLFYGPKVRFNLGAGMSLEAILRVGGEESAFRNGQFLAGATINF